jgi:hypothetical protein
MEQLNLFDEPEETETGGAILLNEKNIGDTPKK